MGIFGDLFKNFFSFFKKKKHIKIGIYGPPNSGKSTLANRITKDVIGEEMSSVSAIPHETREIISKENITIKSGKKELTFDLIDTPGITTKIDYEDFLRFRMTHTAARERAKEGTRGVIEAIRWLDNVNGVVIVLDASKDPYSQVNITIIGNLVARKIPFMIVGNKIDLKRADLSKIENAFAEHKVKITGISALEGQNMEEFYKNLTGLMK